jgi:hypothetical protein
MPVIYVPTPIRAYVRSSTLQLNRLCRTTTPSSFLTLLGLSRSIVSPFACDVDRKLDVADLRPSTVASRRAEPKFRARLAIHSASLRPARAPSDCKTRASMRIQWPGVALGKRKTYLANQLNDGRNRRSCFEHLAARLIRSSIGAMLWRRDWDSPRAITSASIST